MLVYLIRHAEAEDTSPDAARVLTAHGRHQVAQLARFLHASRVFRPVEFWHSPLVRARETAQLLVRDLGLAVPVKEVSGITPDDSPEVIAARIENAGKAIAVVGHEPHLSSLGSLLMSGSVDPVVVAMKKGAVLALERGLLRWVVRWHIEPDLLG